MKASKKPINIKRILKENILLKNEKLKRDIERQENNIKYQQDKTLLNEAKHEFQVARYTRAMKRKNIAILITTLTTLAMCLIPIIIIISNLGN